MAKAQVAARFVTEVAPPQLVSIVRRRQQQKHRGAARSVLDTIAEDDREIQLSGAYSDQLYLLQATTAGDAMAPSPKRPAAASPAGTRKAGGFMRELSGCFSSSNRVFHGRQTAAAGGGGGWGSRREHKLAGHGRRAVYAHQLHGN